MNVLVINCGSSSLKYKLIRDAKDTIAYGLCDRIGFGNGKLKHHSNNGYLEKNITINDHKLAIRLVINILQETKVINSLDEIDVVGHRIVHGGEHFMESVLINDNVLNKIKECMDLAPLHNPSHILGIEASIELMPKTPMIAVFDTAFHQSIDSKVFMYAIPNIYYDKYKIRKYGFHGTSHKYVSNETARFLNININDSKIITCHLGNGCSICAIKNGKSFDTSMGFTPLEGIAMGTRSGDIDPTILQFLMKKENLTIDNVIDILNKKSGVLGISGLSNDFRDLNNAKANGNLLSKLAIDIFVYRVAKYIGSYITAMNGVNAISFCAGIGENDPIIREMIMEYFGYLDIVIDKDANNKTIGGISNLISKDNEIKVCVIPTNEELVIAQDAYKLVKIY